MLVCRSKTRRKALPLYLLPSCRCVDSPSRINPSSWERSSSLAARFFRFFSVVFIFICTTNPRSIQGAGVVGLGRGGLSSKFSCQGGELFECLHWDLLAFRCGESFPCVPSEDFGAGCFDRKGHGWSGFGGSVHLVVHSIRPFLAPPIPGPFKEPGWGWGGASLEHLLGLRLNPRVRIWACGGDVVGVCCKTLGLISKTQFTIALELVLARGHWSGGVVEVWTAHCSSGWLG